jgi:glycosyltransferase involved in cell wall biosynthesis
MIEILYLTWNRLQMTQASLALLAANTNWDLVDRLIVYDDGSTDGTLEYVQEHARIGTTDYIEVRPIQFRSPAAVMNDYLATTEADWFAKIDSDIAVPPLWLESMLSVVERHPEVELLGMDGGRFGVADPWQPPEECGFEPASHIGGVGLMRVESFHRRPPIQARGRQGFTHWQHTHEPVRGWITPGLAVAQLDLIPEEPWASLAAEYVEQGYARHWAPYSALHPWWDWIAEQLPVTG